MHKNTIRSSKFVWPLLTWARSCERACTDAATSSDEVIASSRCLTWEGPTSTPRNVLPVQIRSIRTYCTCIRTCLYIRIINVHNHYIYVYLFAQNCTDYWLILLVRNEASNLRALESLETCQHPRLGKAHELMESYGHILFLAGKQFLAYIFGCLFSCCTFSAFMQAKEMAQRLSRGYLTAFAIWNSHELSANMTRMYIWCNETRFFVCEYKMLLFNARCLNVAWLFAYVCQGAPSGQASPTLTAGDLHVKWMRVANATWWNKACAIYM